MLMRYFGSLGEARNFDNYPGGGGSCGNDTWKERGEEKKVGSEMRRCVCTWFECLSSWGLKNQDLVFYISW